MRDHGYQGAVPRTIGARRVRCTMAFVCVEYDDTRDEECERDHWRAAGTRNEQAADDWCLNTLWGQQRRPAGRDERKEGAWALQEQRGTSAQNITGTRTTDHFANSSITEAASSQQPIGE